MAIDLETLMTGKSDDGLQAYLDNRTKFTPEAIEAAVAEMQKRGRVFSAEELAGLRTGVQATQEAREKLDEEVFGNKLEENIVEDDSAPKYYSEQSIYLFSAFFSVIFGAVLLAINLRNTESRKGVWEVIAFSIAYTAVQLWILSVIPNAIRLTFVFSMAGAVLMNYFFWRKYICRYTKYRTRPVWTPLIIGILLFFPWLLLTNYFRPE